MFYTFVLVLLIVDSIVLMAAVLLQAGKGGGLAASFGGASSSADAFIGIRQAGNLLTKASWWCGGIFLFLAFVLQVSSTRARTPKSVLDRIVAPAPAAPVSGPIAAPTAPANGNVGGSALPLSPVNTAPATPAPAPTTTTKP